MRYIISFLIIKLEIAANFMLLRLKKDFGNVSGSGEFRFENSPKTQRAVRILLYTDSIKVPWR